MERTISDFLNGARMMAASVFGRNKEYHLQFDREEDGCWYIHYPGWPFSHHNLLMVAGASQMCTFLSDDDKFTYVSVIPSGKRLDKPEFAELVQKDHSLAGGSTYDVHNLPGFTRDVWICPVTLFVLGEYPKYIYVRKESKRKR